MSKLILMVLAAHLISCSDKYGYIYDGLTKRPLEGVFVSDKRTFQKNTLQNQMGCFHFLNVMI